MSDDAVAPHVEMLKVYVKDASLEVPGAPSIFNEQQQQPEINIRIANRSGPITENLYEVVLGITATAKVQETIAYLVELQQAGIFSLKGFTQEQLGSVLGSVCPTALFPFAREALASLISKGGFPPLLLNPVNFDSLYRQRLRQQQQPQQSPPPQH